MLQRMLDKYSVHAAREHGDPTVLLSFASHVRAVFRRLNQLQTLVRSYCCGEKDGRAIAWTNQTEDPIRTGAVANKGPLVAAVGNAMITSDPHAAWT